MLDAEATDCALAITDWEEYCCVEKADEWSGTVKCTLSGVERQEMIRGDLDEEWTVGDPFIIKGEREEDKPEKDELYLYLDLGLEDGTGPGEYTANVAFSAEYDGNTICDESIPVEVTVVDVGISLDSSDGDSCELDEEDGKAQFATVKGDGNVILKATVDPDNSEVGDVIDWQGATEDGSDPLKATVSRSTSKRQDVAILVDGTECCAADVWVVWATINLITSDPPGTPDDCELDPENMPDNPPIEYGDESVYIATSEDDWREGSFHFQNGILLQGTISPQAFSNRNDTVDFKFVRTIESCRWAYWNNQNEWSKIYPGYKEPGTDDSPDERTQDTSPSDVGHIYSLDGPGLELLFGNDLLTSEQVQKLNAREWVEIELPGMDWQPCSDIQEWHSVVWVILDDSEDEWVRKANGNSIGGGHIVIEDGDEP